MGARDRARPGHSLAAADDAGHRGRVVGVTVGRSADQLVREIEAGERVHRRDLERVRYVKVRQQARNSFGEHGLADARWTVEEHVVPARRSYLAGPLGLDLANYIGEVETTLRMAVGPLTDDLNGVNGGHRGASQKSDQLSDRADTEDLDSCNEVRLPGLTQRNDHPLEASLLSREPSRQNPAYRPEATVQPHLAQ